MLAALVSLLFLLLPLSAGADEMKLWRVGAANYGMDFETHRTFSVQPKPVAKEQQETRMSGSELRERFGTGLTYGVMQLKWRGELCVSLRKNFDQCDLTIEHDRVLVFSRERKGAFPIRIQFGLRR